MISIPQFWYKSLFFLFLNPWLREERDRGHTDSNNGDKKKIIDTDLSHQNNQCLCKMIPFDKKFILGVFTLKVREKNIYEVSLIFCFGMVFLFFWGHE